MAYKLTDRAKEWTSYAGALVAALGAAIPELMPATQFAHVLSDAQLILGTAMFFMPQTAGSSAVENEALVLLQALSAKVPPQYQQAMQPLISVLTRAAMQPVVQVPLPAPVPVPAPVQAQPVLPPAPPAPQPAAPTPDHNQGLA